MGKQLTIARHEIKVRFFSKLIAINLLILLAVVAFTPWIPQLFSSDKPISIGMYSIAPTGTGDTVLLQRSLRETAKSQGINLIFTSGKSLAEFKGKEIRKETPIVLGLTDANFTITSLEKGHAQLLTFLTNYSQALATSEYLIRNGIKVEDYEKFLATHRASVAIDIIDSDNLSDEQYFASMILNLLLFTLIVLASSHLVMGVVEEKSSHVMEIILYAVKPRQLLLGKLIGISIFIFLQFLVLIVAGYISANFAGVASKADLTFSSVLTVLLWFPPAFLFFAITYSAIGARTSRVEDLGAVQAPLMILVSASLYSSVFAINAPNAQWVQILKYIPPFSFFIESSRSLLGVSGSLEEIASWVIAIVVTAMVGFVGVKSFEKRVFLSQ
jgi:ABC-2 type transport system permease protein